jgi:hypothetical protein
MPSLPTPFRAALGLAAQAIDEIKHLPDRAIELPVLAVSTALQISLRAQQQYAMLAARGDDLLNHRGTTDQPPPWATFDDPASAADPTDDPASAADPTDDPTPAADPTEDRPAPPRKTVRRPRNGPPSRFDAIGDE